MKPGTIFVSFCIAACVVVVVVVNVLVKNKSNDIIMVREATLCYWFCYYAY